ncbi:MAG: SpoIID/LytB domain-containing protein, partial [Frankiales bacterium]|nr:SpoIID/LytB domain-containing protein [Frankiales bacterium]
MRRPASRVRTACLALAGLLGALAVTTVSASPAFAEEVVERPTDGIFAIEGHGWGHGRGMSQWGAQGAASQGKSAETIVSAYYPGTARTVLAAAPIRVLMQGDEGRDTVVFPANGLQVTDVSTGTSQRLPTGPTRWRAVVDTDGLHVQSLTGSTWTAYALGGGTTHGGPIRFSGSEFVRLAYPNGSSRDYRGAVQAVRSGSSSLQSIVVLSMEDYLLGVVPRESSSSWKPAALQAQAVAARSYSVNKRERVAGRGTYDICDTTQCQVFGGTRLYTADGGRSELEPASTTAAVRDTAGVVRTYNGSAIFSEFSSSNGGWSTKGNVPYLIAQRDDWDGAVDNPVHEWDASLRATDLERRFPAVGTLQRIRITGRDGNGDWGGRVKTVVLEGLSASGAPTSVSTTGAGVYNARTWPANSDGLRSTWFRFAPAATPAAAPARGQDSRVSSPSAAPLLVAPPGVSTGRLTVSLVNTGSAPWPVTGLHLAMASPAGQADGLAGRSTRPGAFVRNASRPGADTVSPGDSAEFAVSLNAAGVPPGRYTRAYRARIDDGPVFGATASWQVEVQAARLSAAYAGLPTGAPGSGGAPSAVWADGRTVVVPRNGASAVR